MEDPGPSSAYYTTFPSTSSGPVRPPSPPSSPRQTASPALPEDGLYTLLNIPRTASVAEIRDSYRYLASTYHPDRQRDDVHRATAHRQFTEIQRAYEVLTDPTRRTIYDLFGEEGLKTSWEIGPRVKTPAQLREHFSRQYNAKKIQEAEALVKPRGDISTVLDARAVFANRNLFRHPELMKHDPISRIRRVRPGQVMMKHSFEVPVREKTQVMVTGQMITRGGQGGGNVVGAVRHQFGTRLWGEVGCSALAPRVLTTKATYTIDEHTYLNVNTLQQTLSAPPTFTAQLGRRIYPNTTGFIVYRSGFWTLGPWGKHMPSNPITNALSREASAMSVGVTTARPSGTGWTVETQAGIVANHISADYSWRFWGLKWKVGGAVGSDTGINGFVDSEGKVTAQTRVGCMVSLTLGGGVTMRWRFSRLGQKITIPILLSPDLNPYVVLGSTVLPFSIYAAAYHFLILPRKRQRISNHIKDLRAEHAEHLSQKRTEALEAQDLMARPVAQKVAAEREKGGLIIISAQYGLASAFTDRGVRTARTSEKRREEDGDVGIVEEVEEEVVVDVTIPLQGLVVDSRLYIPGGRGKHNLLGFWDPCIGEAKKLRVRYLFRDQLHEVTISDTSALRAPVQGERSGQLLVKHKLTEQRTSCHEAPGQKAANVLAPASIFHGRCKEAKLVHSRKRPMVTPWAVMRFVNHREAMPGADDSD